MPQMLILILVSDIVLEGLLPDTLEKSAEMYAGCVAGALQQEDYLDRIRKAGFKNVAVKKSKAIHLPDSLLSAYLSKEEIDEFRRSGAWILSITVVGYKP